MIDPDDENALRLVGFVVGLATIAVRQRTYLEAPGHLPREAYPGTDDGRLIIDVRENVILEARAIADTIVEEAKRLRAENNEEKREGE